MASSSPRIYTFDLLRGIAVLTMTLAHSVYFFHRRDSDFLVSLEGFGNVVSYITFLLVSGAVTWVAYFGRQKPSSAVNRRRVISRVLVERLCQAITEHGGHFELNCEVTNLSKGSNGKYRINNLEYDVVVSTVAPGIIKKIVPELEIPDVEYRAAICLIFVLRSPVSKYYWINNLDPSIPFSVIVNQQALLPDNYYHGRYPVYIGHYLSGTSELFSKSDAELAEFYLAHLRKVFPGIDDQVVSYKIGRAKLAQPVITASWKRLEHRTNIPNFYVTSMAHIFPEDRGVNYSIREAKRITELLSERNL